LLHVSYDIKRLVVVAVVIVASLVAATSAVAHNRGAARGGVDADGRIQGMSDFGSVAGQIHRFNPRTGTYSIRRKASEPPMRMHAEGPPPIGVAAGPATTLPPYEHPPFCASSGHRIKVVWSHPPGVGSSIMRDAIRSIVKRMNWKLTTESARSSGSARWLRMVVQCDSKQRIRIYEVVNSGNAPEDVRIAVESALGAPTGGASVKYLVFRDGYDYAGVGYGWTGASSNPNYSIKSTADSGTTANYNRQFTTTAIIWHGLAGRPSPWWTHVTLHELTHTLGGSQYPSGNPAPFASPGAHCLDGLDALCYDDGSIGGYGETRCPANGYWDTPVGVPMDCGYDTYFDAQTESGEWLASYWNVGGPENPFLAETPPPFDPPLDPESDVNGDGQSDLVTLTHAGYGYVYRGQGQNSFGGGVASFNGTMDPAQFDQQGHYVIDVTDVTGDERADMVTLAHTGTAYVYPGQWDGRFGNGIASFSGTMQPGLWSSNGHEPIGVADITGDGRGDLVTFAAPLGRIYVYPGTASGTFGNGVYSLGGMLNSALFDATGHYFLDVADVTGDGRADLVTIDDGGTAHVYAGQAAGTFSSTGSNSLVGQVEPIMDDGSGHEPVGIGDVNGDGHADLVTLHGTTARVFQGQADGQFASGQIATSQAIDSSVLDGTGHEVNTVLDVGGDGYGDLVTVHSNGNGYVYPGNQNGTFGQPVASFNGTFTSTQFNTAGHQLALEKPFLRRRGCQSSGCH
jgi:hypothetical protein